MTLSLTAIAAALKAMHDELGKPEFEVRPLFRC